MTRKILRSILGVAVTILLVSLLVITGFLYRYFGTVQKKQLKDELTLAAAATELADINYLQKLDSKGYRITLMNSVGEVLFDTQVEKKELGNHGDREEFQEAIQTGRGSSYRYSSTLMEKTLYEAVRLENGNVLRISVSQATIGALILGLIWPFICIVIGAFLLSVFWAKKIAKNITGPLNQLNLEAPLENNTYEELAPLLNRIYRQHNQIEEQLSDLQKQKDKFKQVTENMKEGLVLLDEKGRILSINPAAMLLFQTSESCIGEDFLTIERKTNMRMAMEKAMKEGHSEIRGFRNGREYQFDISRIESDGKVVGEVLLAFDITRQAEAERMRREFSANVSHELKTPLQSIMGSAELIQNEMVKQEDLPRFVGHIYTEASRLVTLVEDIIRLSQLDEGYEMTYEKVRLQEITREAIGSLQDEADKREVRILFNGDSGEIYGVRRLLYEIIYNLCDNAIKYNKQGGLVQITITETEKEIEWLVKDTGIGIPKEHQERVFERFYRVDKSHSKKSGGTGLGLSIVKHAVQYHNGKISVTSDPENGTAITVSLPLLW